MRVVHLVAPAAVGGLETVVAALASGHRSRGIDAGVVAILDPGAGGAPHPFRDGLLARGVPVTAIEVPPRRYGFERGQVADAIRTLSPDIIHTHGYRADVVDAPVARRAGLPVLTTVHGFTGGTWRNRLYEALQVRAYRNFDAVVAVSRPLAAVLARRGVPAGVLRTIPNAWSAPAAPLGRGEARARLGMPPDAVVVGFVGRLTAEKGADVMVAALPLLTEPAARLAIVGDGRERPALRQQAERAGVARRIDWHPAVTGAGALLAAFDAVVISSRTEGTPMVLFEAIAAGVPVVTTAVGGIPDVVSEREALLVPPDDPPALAAALRAVLADRAAAGHRAAAASARLASHFAAEPWLASYADLYHQLAGR